MYTTKCGFCGEQMVLKDEAKQIFINGEGPLPYMCHDCEKDNSVTPSSMYSDED